ncbi:MAG: adenylate/guanylate cyclase domain-containing protein [Aquificota bacterium]|nr:MAG: adenylate/guanylate cyclase domain-containing protein [Aquificota bacterium]
MRGWGVYLIASALTLIVFLLWLLKPSPLERGNLLLQDLFYTLRRAVGQEPTPHPAVVVVAIDGHSVKRLGRWPWDRRVMAQVIRNLSSAKVVLLDIVFSEPQSLEQDQELARAMAQAGNVVLGFFLRQEQVHKPDPMAEELLKDGEFLRYTKTSQQVSIASLPYADLNLTLFMESALSWGVFNAEPDIDGLYRKYPTAYGYRGSIYLSLGLQALRFYSNKDIEMTLSQRGIEKLWWEGREIPLYRGRFVLLNFYPHESIKVVPAWEVYEGKADLKDKVVFLGATEIGIYDIRATPISPITPGVYLHATAFSNLYKGEFLRHSQVVDLLLLSSTALLPLVFQLIKSLYVRFALFTTSLILLYLVSFSLFVWVRYLVEPLYPMLNLGLVYLFLEGRRFLQEELRVLQLKRAFSTYVSPQLLEVIIKNPERLRLGGETREVSVLFSDVRGFTTLSESLEPEVLVSILNRYLEPMTQIVLQEGGMLDKYIGDAIMAVFNAPVDLPDHPTRACRTALRMLKTLREINAELKRDFGITIDVGVGINTGRAVVGNMGSSLRFDYTAIGDTVNLASRLEGLNKLYGTHVLVSEFTKAKAESTFLFRAIDKVAVKGKKKPVLIYELMEDNQKNAELSRLFEHALDLYFKGRFEEAMLEFEELSIGFNDPASAVFVRRCSELIKEPPEYWEGVYYAKEK